MNGSGTRADSLRHSPRVLVAQIVHETNTFSRLLADEEAFRRRELILGEDIRDAFANTASELGAFMAAGRRYGWEIVPAVAAEATPSGPVTRTAWQMLLAEVLGRLRRDGPWAGILLALHGAMVAEHDEDADGAIVAAIREIVGPDLPIVATLDLHANVSGRLAGLVQGLIAYRTYPHVDQFERGEDAAALLQQVLQTGRRPRVVLRRGALLDGCDHGRSSGSLMPHLLDIAARRTVGNLAWISLQAGFPWADVPHAGPSVAVTHWEDTAAAEDAAGTLMDAIWQHREESSLQMLSPSEALARARAIVGAGGRVVLADGGDNPGGGGYGDATNLLRALIAADLGRLVFAPIWDPGAATVAAAAGLGSRVRLAIGGNWDSSRGGASLAIEAAVIWAGEASFTCDGPVMRGRRLSLGTSAVLRAGSADIVVTSNRAQVTDRNYLRCVGLHPEDYQVIGIKSFQHFRADFAPIADLVLVVDGGGVITQNLRALGYRRIRRPIWPLDDVAP